MPFGEAAATKLVLTHSHTCCPRLSLRTRTCTCTLFSSFYAAPEIIAKSRVGEGYDPLKSDIWSCGVILYCMLTGRAPFRVAVPEDPSFARLVIEGAYPFPRTLSQSARDLLGSLLSVDPAGRPAADDILKSEWCSMTAVYDTPWFACQGPVERPLLSSSRPSKRHKTEEDSTVDGAGGTEGGGAEQSSFIETSEGKEATRAASEPNSDGGAGPIVVGGSAPVTSDEEEVFMVGSVIHPLGWGGIPGGPSTVDVCIGRIEAVLSAHFGEQNKRRSTSGGGGPEGGSARSSAGGSAGGGGGASGGRENGDEVIHVGIRGSVVFVGNMRTAMAVTVVAETKETVRICQQVSKRRERHVHCRCAFGKILLLVLTRGIWHMCQR